MKRWKYITSIDLSKQETKESYLLPYHQSQQEMWPEPADGQWCGYLSKGCCPLTMKVRCHFGTGEDPPMIKSGYRNKIYKFWSKMRGLEEASLRMYFWRERVLFFSRHGALFIGRGTSYNAKKRADSQEDMTPWSVIEYSSIRSWHALIQSWHALM